MGEQVFRVNEKDQVAVALTDLKEGQTVCCEGEEILLLEDIPFGHKVALQDLAAGQKVLKYGYPIGHAGKDIRRGEWVHSQNLSTDLNGVLSYEYHPQAHVPVETGHLKKTFQGYVRADGSVGTRNEIWVIPTVSCVNPTVRILAEEANKTFGALCEGIYALPHNAGCSQLGSDHEITQKILASIVRHPNAGGVLLVSLGCENNDFDHFLPVLGEFDPKRIKCMVTQDADGDEIEQGLRLIGEIAQEISHDKREEVSVDRLKIAFKCGGSDAFSGLTANPLCGQITDRITELGGSAVLTEVPEMFGAETILMNRADGPQTFEKIVKLINGFKEYYLSYNQPVYENPSPGNKKGGITTLEEKSLGCIQKGGNAIVTDTLDYGEKCVKPGLNLMTGPGNDSVSITDLLCTGAQIFLFTTGRGNPLGTAVPTIKISSNDKLYERKKNWIDYNAGQVLDHGNLSEAADDLWRLILETASGEYRTKNERHGYREIMIFKDGVLL